MIGSEGELFPRLTRPWRPKAKETDMDHKGTYYGIEYGEYGWQVTVGMKVVCDHLETEAEAVRWIESR